MANRSFNRLQALEKEIKQLHLKIVTDGSGDVTSISGAGIASVSHTTDTYTITLEDKYVSFKGATVLPGVHATSILVSEDVNGAKTVVIDLSATQVSVDVHVIIHVKNTTVL